MPWPEADRLFHGDPRWLGADAAGSIPLGDGRILWLFGDTFVVPGSAGRSSARMVHNSIGTQVGDDPTTATMRFRWRGSPDAPEPFFPDDGAAWWWPGHGIRLDRALVIFLQRVRATPGRGLGFEATGWGVAIVDDATGDPDGWAPRLVASAGAPPGLVVGSAVVLDGDRVVALAQRDPGDHAGFLVRWPREALAAGELDRAEWWLADRGWVAQGAFGGPPAVALRDAGPESSLHRDPVSGRWVHVRSEGFGATTIVVSEADRLEGPWSAPREVARPAESGRPGVLVYAAKAHPELAAGGALAITYATNASSGLAGLVADPSLYYPRFLRLPR